ncbi:MAG: hypothetical protein R3E83_00155 [Burkholderiaceae bacterium]
MLAALDFVHAHNQGLALDLPPTIEVFRLRETLPLPAEDGYCRRSCTRHCRIATMKRCAPVIPCSENWMAR